jgi:hypothetical protein
MKHNPDHGNPNHDLACVRQIFVILAETAMLIRTCEGSLNHPSSGNEGEPSAAFRAGYDFHDHSEISSHPYGDTSVVNSVGKYRFRTGKTVEHTRKKKLRSVTIPNSGAANYDGYDQSERIGENVTPPSVRFFVAGTVRRNKRYDYFLLILSHIRGIGFPVHRTISFLCFGMKFGTGHFLTQIFSAVHQKYFICFTFQTPSILRSIKRFNFLK